MNLMIDIKQKDQKYIVNLSGEIDVFTAPKLKDALIPLTEKKDQIVDIDLQQVTYLDSTGLGVFISALKSTKKHQSHMQLVHLQDRVYRLFKITGLHEIMNIKGKDEVKTINGDV